MRALAKALVVVVAVMGILLWAQLAPSSAGLGNVTVSDYHISPLAYDFNGAAASAVHFNLAPPTAKVVTVSVDGRTWSRCRLSVGYAFCPLSVAAAALTSISVVARG